MPGQQHPISDWLTARRDYVEGKGSIRVIAKRYNMPFRTVQGRATAERWTTARANYVQRQLEDVAPPAPEPPITGFPAKQTNTNHPERVAWLEAHMQRLQNLLETETNPDHIKKLTDAYAKHFEQWRILSNIPLPGSRRPPRTSSRPALPMFAEPIEMDIPDSAPTEPADPNSLG